MQLVSVACGLHDLFPRITHSAQMLKHLLKNLLVLLYVGLDKASVKICVYIVKIL